MIRLHDTAQNAVVPLNLRDPGKASVYVCGPTVYAPPHIGHGRQVLVYDILRRFLLFTGLDVTFVSNVTDIDDAIIERGQREDRDPAEIAVKCEGIWWRAMDRLNALRPDKTPHATEYVAQMVELIDALVQGQKAYITSDGVYLRVSEVPGYGLLAGQSLDDLMEGGGDREVVGTEKENPADFVLWKFSKPGEPVWPSPWGEGRPGWHTECVVMSLDLLGENFDLHAGGLDLTFPHHENERAQAVAMEKGFARHWMHHGFVELEGAKMSKSLGNVKNLLDLTEQYDPRAYRLLVLQSHYRSPMEVTEVSMTSSTNAVDRLDAFARSAGEVAATAEPDPAIMQSFVAAMENDLATATAVDVMFRAVKEGNSLLAAGDAAGAGPVAAAALLIAETLGLELKATAESAPQQIMDLVHRREEARAERDFGAADALRDEVLAAGWSIEDSAAGPIVRQE